MRPRPTHPRARGSGPSPGPTRWSTSRSAATWSPTSRRARRGGRRAPPPARAPSARRDLAFGGDMVAYIEAGAPESATVPVDGARLLAPLRPRSMRDFLAFEGHLHAALSRLGRPIPDEWYDTPAYYKGMPDTVIGPEDE